MPESALPGAATARRLSGLATFGLFQALSFALNYPYLTGGFQADDLLFINMFHQRPLPFSRWLGAWSVPVDGFSGFVSLWWFEPGVSGSFFRPLPSLIFETSLRLFGDNAVPLHMLSLLLHGLVAFTVFRLFARLSGRTGVAFLAGLIFVTCEDHSMGVGWIATMTDLLCVAFINLALIAHVRWRQAGRSIWFAVSTVTMMLGLASKESASVAPLAVVLLEWFHTGSFKGFARRARFWAPSLILLAAYLILYRALGLGAMRNLMYVDPRADPVAFAGRVLTGLPVIVSAALSVIPPSLAAFDSRYLLPVAMLGAVLGVLFVWGLWPFRRDPVAGWALVMFVLALLPQLATDPSERLLYFPFVPMSFLLARLLATVPPLARCLTAGGAGRGRPDRRAGAPAVPGALGAEDGWGCPATGPAMGAAAQWGGAGRGAAQAVVAALPIATRLWGWYVLAGVLIPGAILSGYLSHVYVPSLQRPDRDISTSLSAVRARLEEHPSASVVLLNTSGPMLTFYAGGVYEYRIGHPVPTFVLSSLNGKVTIEKAGPRAFILRTDRPGWLTNMFARIVRLDPSLTPGRVYRHALFDATIVERTDDGSDALAVRFDFHRDLDDAELLFLTWNGERFVPLALGALPPGERVPLADTSDFWKSWS